MNEQERQAQLNYVCPVCSARGGCPCDTKTGVPHAERTAIQKYADKGDRK